MDRRPELAGLPSWRLLFAVWAGIIVAQILFGTCGGAHELSYTKFEAELAANNVASVAIGDTAIRGQLRAASEGATAFRVVRVEDPTLLDRLREQKVEVSGLEEPTPWSRALAWVAPIVLAVVLMTWLSRRALRGLGPMSVGRSKARVYMERDIDVTFDDVAGVDEAVEELTEVVEFLRTPDKFQRLGGKLPKGILLVGPPGTGKTLLARAVAGQAGVPFFSISGSEFVEMFVGVGAARVRDLFTEAKARAPCIIFIDELDALGKARGFGPMAHEEREQTLNQLLVELDGFDPHVGVILMAATNRPEILDPALLRAGRFDRQVLVDRPDKQGRRAILEVHARKVRLADDADLGELAAMTAGFAGADLANIVNEAALLAARRGCPSVGGDELIEAVERVVAGLEKRSRVLSATERARVAAHEVGHALMALLIPGGDPVRKISIIPRGIAALGYTLQLPTQDRFLLTRGQLEDRIAVLLGGRVAEQLVFGEVSTGAQDDLIKATDIARAMVTAYGMSDELGQLSFERGGPPSLLGGEESARRREVSDDTAREIDAEIRRIVDAQYARASELLDGARGALERGAERLVAEETLSGEALAAILSEDRCAPRLAERAIDVVA
jgi:cell division protease FtsH